MAKRKHEEAPGREPSVSDSMIVKAPRTDNHVDVKTALPAIHIIAGSYERVLHGVVASLQGGSEHNRFAAQFAETFLFHAHASAIRCLALSPLPDAETLDSQGVYLASGGSDEKINLYNLAATPVLESKRLPAMPSIGENKIQEDPRNRELGSVLHHSSSITALYFPTRSKLLSASEDNTIAVSRTKDLSVLSTVKAPRPKAHGQPSGDTSPAGMTPAGINDFAVHPSMKLMLSVGRGERCMRLWNLVTGKKAGVLNFEKQLLQQIKEGKYSSGEGRKIRWNSDGTEFAVAFERGAIIFGADSKARLCVLPQPLTKLHQISYFDIPISSNERLPLFVASTEDGRILFYSTRHQSMNNSESTVHSTPNAVPVAQLGGSSTGIVGRIKDFEIIQISSTTDDSKVLIVITANSDGTIRVWEIAESSFAEVTADVQSEPARQIGILIGTYETGSRITCLVAYLMQPPSDDVGISEFEGLTEGEDAGQTDNESGKE